jgi:hypothetical protein
MPAFDSIPNSAFQPVVKAVSSGKMDSVPRSHTYSLKYFLDNQNASVLVASRTCAHRVGRKVSGQLPIEIVEAYRS